MSIGIFNKKFSFKMYSKVDEIKYVNKDLMIDLIQLLFVNQLWS